MAMISPFFVGKGDVYLYNLNNDSVRNHAFGFYVLVHAYTPSTNQSIQFPASTLRLLEISHFHQQNTSITAKGSSIRLGQNCHYIHDLNTYPTPSILEQTGDRLTAKPESLNWEPIRMIGGTMEDPVVAGGVARIDTESAVSFMGGPGQTSFFSEEWLMKGPHGLPDGHNLPALEELVGADGADGVRAKGSTITFGLCSKPRDLWADLDDWEGTRHHRLDEGFEFAQVELAHATMPIGDNATKGGREVLLFIKLSREQRKHSSLYIEQQKLDWHARDILREISQGRGESLVVVEKFGVPRKRKHDWQRWSGSSKTKWIRHIMEIVVEGSRGFNAQAFEEVRASLQIEDSVEIMEFLIRKFKKEAHAILNVVDDESRYRFAGLKDAITYITDRRRGTVNYLQMAENWIDRKIPSHEVLGKQVQKPKIKPAALPLPVPPPLPPRKKNAEDVAKPKLQARKSSDKALKERQAPMQTDKPQPKLKRSLTHKAIPEVDEEKDLQLFSNASGQPLPQGILKKKNSQKVVNPGLALRNNNGTGNDGQKDSAEDDASQSDTMIALQKLHAQHEQTLLEAERQMAHRKLGEEALREQLREAASMIIDDDDEDMEVDYDAFDQTFPADLGFMDDEEIMGDGGGGKRDKSTSLSSHASLSIYHSADGEDPASLVEEEASKAIVIEDSPKMVDEGRGDGQEIKMAETEIGLTPIKESNQGFLAKLKMAQEEKLGKAVGLVGGLGIDDHKEAEVEDEKMGVKVAVEEVTAIESEHEIDKAQVKAQGKMDDDEVGAGKTLALGSA